MGLTAPPPDPVAMGFGLPEEVAAGLVWYC